MLPKVNPTVPVLVFLSFSTVAALPLVTLGGDRESLHIPAPSRPSRSDDSYTRMFPGLPAFAPVTDATREQMKKLGERRSD